MLRTLSCLCILPALALADPTPPISAPIVGGTPVPAGAWLDVVAVVAVDGACTGTLIAPDVVLTAGHCIELGPFEVVTHTTDYARPGGDRIPVKWARAYPDWEHRYDIGVLMLDRVAIPQPRSIATACVANERLAAGVPLQIVGFGLVTPAGSDDNTRLHEATVAVLDAFCDDAPGCEPSVRPNGEFTAGGRGTDACFGDSGGPALVDTPTGPALVGVVSRGLALPGIPCGNGGVYVRADKVVAWIQRVTGRKLTRTGCEGRRDEPDPPADAATGCAVGGDLGLAAAGLVVALRRRRRRTTS